MERYFQPEIECASREQLKAWQDERLVKQVRHVWDNVPSYRKKMEEKGVTPEDIRSSADLYKLPFTSKADLRDNYPDGLVAVPRSKCVRVHATSGTTGKRVMAFYTQHDIDLWTDCCARAITAVGGSEEDVCQIAYGYGMFTGGIGLDQGSRRVGCLTVPISSGNTDRQIQFIRDLGTTILCCTPSYAAYLGESMHEMGMTPDQIPLKAGIFGAEAWSEEMRQDIQNTLGIKAYDIYGLTELSGPGVAFECSAQSGMHINEDHFIAEIIDPDTGEVWAAYEDIPDGANWVERPVKYRDVDYTVAALVTVPSALSYRYYGSDEFILNDETFVQDTGTDSVMYYAFDTTDEANAAMESFLADYTGNVNPELDYESKATYATEFESMRSMFLLLGGALSFIVGLVGVLNFFNAVLTGIIARRRELAVLQAVGMTGRQLRAMLVWEGLLYALGAAGLALLNEYDGKIKKLLTGIFGAENDFDAILGGVNLAGVGANGKRVLQNLSEALTPILREGAERRLTAAADAAAARADAARAEQAILKELDDLRTGPITEEELEDCRLSLLSGMAGIEDTLGGIETWYYMEVLRGGPVQTPDDARAALQAVTEEDVRTVLRQLTLSVSYLLTREEESAHA